MSFQCTAIISFRSLQRQWPCFLSHLYKLCRNQSNRSLLFLSQLLTHYSFLTLSLCSTSLSLCDRCLCMPTLGHRKLENEMVVKGYSKTVNHLLGLTLFYSFLSNTHFKHTYTFKHTLPVPSCCILVCYDVYMCDRTCEPHDASWSLRRNLTLPLRYRHEPALPVETGIQRSHDCSVTGPD